MTPKLHGKTKMILRERYLNELVQAFEAHPIMAILGPRQCGKMTLAKQYISSQGNISQQNYFDLEIRLILLGLKIPR
jgi:hypothetical protein